MNQPGDEREAMSLRERLVAAFKARKHSTTGEWHHGPPNCAGNVWVYADGKPIGEPDPWQVGFRAWFTPGFGRKEGDRDDLTLIQKLRGEKQNTTL